MPVCVQRGFLPCLARAAFSATDAIGAAHVWRADRERSAAARARRREWRRALRRGARSAWLGGLFVAAGISSGLAQDESCLACHEGSALTMTRGDREVSLAFDPAVFARSVHAGLNCADCHVGFEADSIPHREPMTPVNCRVCHDVPASSHQFHPRLAALAGPANEADAACAGCHGGHDVVAVSDAAFRFATGRQTESCGACHRNEAAAFLNSAHHGGEAGAPYPSCVACHQTNVVSGADTGARKVAQSQVCLSCHVDQPAAAGRTRLGGKFVASWGSSVHGRALQAGNAQSANCVDCHGSHEMQRAMVAESRVNKLHIPATCRSCHATEANEFAAGAHAAALSRGATDAPVCTDCHGEHLIFAAHDPRSPVAPRNVSQQLCGECHGSVRLSQKYGISSDRFQTFADSYHGLAVRGGAVEVVNCASCHGAHAILPSSDPRSPINKANLAQTCGQCHPGANEMFAVGSVHVTLGPGAAEAGAPASGERIIAIVATVYLWGIALIVGGMFAHNGLDFLKKLRRKVRGHRHAVAPAAVPHRLYLRMSANERLQHGALVLSFVVLVITGFMLRYPEAWWVVSLRHVSAHLFELRSWLHRAAAVVMVAAGAWHLGYVLCTTRGRELIRGLWPRWSDFTDAIGVLRYNLGLAPTKPQFGRFSYIEKTEYWALLWGAVIMTLTGVLLWADDTTMGWLTKLGFDIARTVHFYEAVLASLAIGVWHFYFVIFNPDVYPMNLSWLTGYLSEEEMTEEHPRELERLQRETAAPGAAAAGETRAPDQPPPQSDEPPDQRPNPPG